MTPPSVPISTALDIAASPGIVWSRLCDAEMPATIPCEFRPEDARLGAHVREMRDVFQLTFLLALLLIAIIGSGARAQTTQPSTSMPVWAPAVDSMMRAELARSHVPGAQIAIAMNGRVVYTRGYGVADVESGRPVTDRTLFQVGSIAKMITGAMLAQLASEGTVDLHAPISRYVPELAGRRVGTATVHQLLTNSAGWADWARPFGTTDDGALGRNMSSVADTMILTDAGRVYSYSNPGFAMAGYVAERVTKTPFADLGERIVLRRMGMPRATFRPLVAMTYDFALGHAVDSAGGASVIRPMPTNAAEYPAGFLWTSAAELARLGIALNQGGMLDGERVLSADAARAMTTGYIRVPVQPHAWSGYGMHVDTVAGQRYWLKSGSVRGYHSQLGMWPDLGLVVVVSGNSLNEMPTRAHFLAAEIVSGRRLQRPPPVAERPATREDQRQVVGKYRTGTGTTTVEIVDVDGKLEYRGTRLTYPLRMVSADRLVGQPPGQPERSVLVIRDASGRVNYLFAVNAVLAKQP